MSIQRSVHPVTIYMIYDHKRKPIPHTARIKKRDSIKAIAKDAKEWSKLYHIGFECIKVELRQC